MIIYFDNYLFKGASPCGGGSTLAVSLKVNRLRAV